jgi:hypothetical protein
MKLKYLLTVAAIVAVAKTGFAQYSQDALRFSTFQTGTTSRIKAIGNAGTAIGGDLSSIGGNPAGIGFFTRSEMSITPEFDISKVNSTYFNQSGSGSNNNLNLANVAAVFYSQLNTPRGGSKTEGWLSFNFGISYNRTNNYYENVNYGGINPTNSITDYYASDANSNTTGTASGAIYNNTLGAWGYNQNLIDQYTVNGSNVYRSNATYPTPKLNPNGYSQQSNAIRTGGESELSMSVGANYSNKFYLGFGLGITNLRYNNNAYFNESGIASVYVNPGYANQTYTNVYSQDQETKGTGVNLKLGMIYKPVEAVRLGAVITTPTWYNIDDNYNEGLSTKLNGTSTINNGPSNYPFSYRLATPLKVAGGLAIFFKQYGFISGDVEYLDYSSASLSGDYSSSGDNNDIKTLYQSAVNAHVGAEARLTSQVFLRGGYGVQGNPLKNNGSQINTTSGGIGYRNSDYYIDLTYSHLSGSQTVYPYEIGASSPAAFLSKTNDNVYVTVGFRF